MSSDATIMNDPQFGTVHVMRPYRNFQVDYAGKPVLSTPIMFSENGDPLDPLAGTPGYASTLLRGLAIPLGTKIIVWLPIVFGGVPESGPPFTSIWFYDWKFIWRYRNIFDFRQNRNAYHYIHGLDLATNESAIPAAYNAISYIQAVSTNQEAPTTVLRTDIVSSQQLTDGTPVLDPILPLIPGAIVGTISSSSTSRGGVSKAPFYTAFEMEAKGDELLIAMNRLDISSSGAPATVTNWTFLPTPNAVDRLVGNFFGGTGNPDLGVYIAVGKH